MSLQSFRYEPGDVSSSLKQLVDTARHTIAVTLDWEEGNDYVKDPRSNARLYIYSDGNNVYWGVGFGGTPTIESYGWNARTPALVNIATSPDGSCVGIGMNWDFEPLCIQACVSQNTLGDYVGFVFYPKLYVLREKQASSNTPLSYELGYTPTSLPYCVASVNEYPDVYATATFHGMYQVLTFPSNLDARGTFEINGNSFIILRTSSITPPCLVLRTN